MGVYAKGLLLAAILASLAASVLLVSTGAALFDTPWSVWITAAALFIGGVITRAVYSSMGATRPPRASLTPAPESVATASSPPAPAVGATCFADNAFLAFIEQLMAATTSDELHSTVQAQLPQLIGGRKVWMVSDSQRTPVPGAPVPERRPDLQLATDVQEWTTFPLRLNDKSVGLLGVESAGGLGADRRAAIQRITVLLARAVSTVDAIETLREAGLVDLLTGTATRREGFNRLQSEVKRAQRTGAAMAIVMLDLDHFKSVNDRFGHAVGDALLTAIGRTLQSTLRASDIRCRWGGEEFLIVLPDSDLSRGQVVAMHLLQNIAATYVPTPSGPVTTTASIGVTISRPGETTISNLVARADLALYRAKREGRSCVRVVLGDHDGKAIAAQADASEPGPPRHSTLPFPDRRSPRRADRRRVASSGRRRTDPVPPPADAGATEVDASDAASAVASADDRRRVLTGVQ
jgi:diguanylate cyclase (GGDEF)-like protein